MEGIPAVVADNEGTAMAQGVTAMLPPPSISPPALTLDPLVGKGGQLPRQWASRGSSGPLQVRTPAGRGASAGDGVMESEAGTQWGLGRG